MFDRRRQSESAMNFVQASRRLRNGEHVPAIPGLADQLLAFRDGLARSQQQMVEDEVNLYENEVENDGGHEADGQSSLSV